MGCDKSCAVKMKQKDPYNLDLSVKYVLAGLRSKGDDGKTIGNIYDFFNFHRNGYSGWDDCKGKGLKKDSFHCKCYSHKTGKDAGCDQYQDAIGDIANRIAENP